MPATAKARAMPKWKPAPEALVQLFEQAVQSLPQAQLRKTFGYPSAYFEGKMFAGLHQDSFILKLPAEERAALLKHKGAKPFEPMPGRVMGEYMVVPESVLGSRAQLESWLAKALTYVQSLPAKPSKGAKKPRLKKQLSEEKGNESKERG